MCRKSSQEDYNEKKLRNTVLKKKLREMLKEAQRDARTNKCRCNKCCDTDTYKVQYGPKRKGIFNPTGTGD